MASTSSSGRREQGCDPFLVLEPPNKKMKSSSAKLFDVFINHRGPDVKTTLALQLYNSLKEDGIQVYLDCEETELGDSLSSTIKNAIFSAAVHIAILSPRYTESAWCLSELALMFQTKARIIPLFYLVDPSDFRHIKNKVAEGFSKHKSRYPNHDIQQWKECLQSVSGIKGYELRGQNDDLNKLCKDVVSAVKKEKQRRKIPFQVAKYEVGLDDLVEDFHSHCQRNGQMIDKIIGIFGMGGSGKTTLVKDLFNRKHSEFSGSTSLFDVREKHVKGELTSLQSELLKELFHENDHKFCSVEVGTAVIKDYLQRSRESRFLIVIDDVDHRMQLDALLPIDALNPNSLVIVTTRDERLLIQAGVRVRYKMKEMNAEHSRELFCWHAFHTQFCKRGYENLVDNFVQACAGLPLALQVMGAHVFGSDKGYWKLQLDDVKARLHRDIKHRLKISYDALEEDQKQIFMDISCFFIGKKVSTAISIWKASGWRAEHALQILKDKCLVGVEFFRYSRTNLWPMLRMHDHLRDLGREMADNEMNPRRLWRPKDLIGMRNIKGFQDILMKSEERNFRCFNHILKDEIGSLMTYFLQSSKTSTDLQWLNIYNDSDCDISCEIPEIPEWIPVQNLQTLIVDGLLPLKLWQRDDQAPVKLKELQCIFRNARPFEKDLFCIYGSELLRSFGMLKHLESLHLTLHGQLFETLQPTWKISISGQLCPTLKSLKLYTMTDLNEVDLTGVTTLERLELFQCRNLRKVLGNDLLKLEMFLIQKCWKMKELPNFGRVSCLKRINIRGCWNLQNISAIESLNGLKRIWIADCPNLQNIKATEQLKGLKRIWIENCQKLQDTICFKELKKLKRILIVDCPKLQNIEGIGFLMCLESIMIHNCGKLQNIRGIEELKGLKEMIISDTPIISCVERLQRLPWERTILVRRSAMSNLKAEKIGDSLTMADAFCVIESGEQVEEMIRSFHKTQHSLSTFIFCGMFQGGFKIKYDVWVDGGRWIYMCVVNEEMLSKYDSWKPASFHTERVIIMGVKKESERKTLDILQRLFAQLCDGDVEDEEYYSDYDDYPEDADYNDYYEPTWGEDDEDPYQDKEYTLYPKYQDDYEYDAESDDADEEYDGVNGDYNDDVC